MKKTIIVSIILLPIIILITGADSLPTWAILPATAGLYFYAISIPKLLNKLNIK